MQPLDLLSVFIFPLEQSGFEYMVTGSVAATLYGEPRLTHDVDLVLMLKISDINRFISCFPQSAYYCPPAEIIRIELQRKDFAHFNLIHHASGYKADCYPFTGNPLHSWALTQRRRIPVHSNLTIQVAPPEYVILRKMQYFKEGGSQKHLLDIQKMVHTPDCLLDHSIIDEWIRELGLENVWEKVNPPHD